MTIFDHWWWLMIPGLLLGLYAQMKLSSAYSRFSQVPAQSGLTGAQAAREVLDSAGLQDTPVAEVEGRLTDHYDPLAAVGVAAHEAGHALQHKAAYAPLKFRMALVPVTQIATTAATWITFGGYIMGTAFLRPIIGVAIGVFAVITFFQLVTLPVEYDASRRAKDQLVRLGLVQPEERRGVSKVLDAAALTYVAAMVASLFTLLHLLLIARGNDRD